MFLIGDIGNTETKICLLNENLQIKKRLIFSTNLKKIGLIKKNLKLFISKKIDLEFCLFSSVVPNFYRILIRGIIRSEGRTLYMLCSISFWSNSLCCRSCSI